MVFAWFGLQLLFAQFVNLWTISNRKSYFTYKYSTNICIYIYGTSTMFCVTWKIILIGWCQSHLIVSNCVHRLCFLSQINSASLRLFFFSSFWNTCEFNEAYTSSITLNSINHLTFRPFSSIHTIVSNSIKRLKATFIN